MRHWFGQKCLKSVASSQQWIWLSLKTKFWFILWRKSKKVKKFVKSKLLTKFVQTKQQQEKSWNLSRFKKRFSKHDKRDLTNNWKMANYESVNWKNSSNRSKFLRKKSFFLIWRILVQFEKSMAAAASAINSTIMTEIRLQMATKTKVTITNQHRPHPD